ncbi:sorbitol dehydrogenase [Staphylococcus aureus]|uniref:Sorbitol dehydrogenase n=1 Tax=Staphylococcus aureus TaxID=1280 RepID=A0A380DNC7_STAAU|nr:sorbitol dehydrogenase [Staphylococcus aureus]
MAKGTNVQMPKGSSEFQVLIKVVISLTILSLNYLVYSIKNRGVCGESFSKTREGHGNLELLDKEVATPLDDKVKIKVHYAGIVEQYSYL